MWYYGYETVLEAVSFEHSFMGLFIYALNWQDKYLENLSASLRAFVKFLIRMCSNTYIYIHLSNFFMYQSTLHSSYSWGKNKVQFSPARIGYSLAYVRVVFQSKLTWLKLCSWCRYTGIGFSAHQLKVHCAFSCVGPSWNSQPLYIYVYCCTKA